MPTAPCLGFFHMRRLHSEAAISEKMISGPRIDSAMLQLIGVLFASILFNKFKAINEDKNAFMNIATCSSFNHG
eukprot:5233937-Amphidinium_carterae.1